MYGETSLDNLSREISDLENRLQNARDRLSSASGCQDVTPTLSSPLNGTTQLVLGCTLRLTSTDNLLKTALGAQTQFTSYCFSQTLLFRLAHLHIPAGSSLI